MREEKDFKQNRDGDRVGMANFLDFSSFTRGASAVGRGALLSIAQALKLHLTRTGLL